MRRLLATLCFTTLSACSGIGGVGEQIDGTWVGSSAGTAITMQIVQTGGVTGIATLTGGAGPARSLAVTGNFVSPNLTATLSGSAPSDTIKLNATVTGKTMVGTLIGSEFSGGGIAMTRQ
jgi:hypothetical protein